MSVAVSKVAGSDRESVRARIRVATDLAIGNHPDQAHAALLELAGMVDPDDREMRARFLLVRALTYFKERAVDDAFAQFDLALQMARAHGEPSLLAGILTNYGTAAAQDGSIATAVACLEERQALCADSERASVGGLALAEALFVAGDLRRCAELLHDVYARYAGTVTLLGAAAVGIPVGVMLADDALLARSYNPALLELAFSRGEQWLIGPLAESVCALYEHEGRREAHDVLLRRAVDRLTSLDNSLGLAIRAARLADERDIPRIAALVSQQYANPMGLPAAHRDLFEGTVALRRGRASVARKAGLRAAREFARADRPLGQASALELAGRVDEARAVRRVSGARDEMRRRWHGAPISQRPVTQLTAREAEVAQLAAGGSSNRAIAQQLGVSERTVHRHCESIFAKLGIHSRWQLKGSVG